MKLLASEKYRQHLPGGTFILILKSELILLAFYHIVQARIFKKVPKRRLNTCSIQRP
ncbi:hypothetical protein [Metabacillus fastidiosus]|uniref:hypothetical protein n=1 Tax=Metabacillus fastidiosus TaxID=1458 RepID=UPI002DB89079|nr:hypothetical protein [Metabacillus fastidiosus]MEC2078344.1 hypothetical protein [Metabacillus fastidiosus]